LDEKLDEKFMKKDIICDWGHNPYWCAVCIKECVPHGACMHHGFKKKK